MPCRRPRVHAAACVTEREIRIRLPRTRGPAKPGPTTVGLADDLEYCSVSRSVRLQSALDCGSHTVSSWRPALAGLELRSPRLGSRRPLHQLQSWGAALAGPETLPSTASRWTS